MLYIYIYILYHVLSSTIRHSMNMDNTLIQKELNWEPSTSLKDGMRKTYDWIYEQMVAAKS